MSLHVVVVTLGAAPAAISVPAAGSPSIRCKELRLESETGNAAVLIGDQTLTATNYGCTLLAGPAAAFNFRVSSHSIDLSSVFLSGTNGQKVHVTYTQ
jgi:hypothetical protein